MGSRQRPNWNLNCEKFNSLRKSLNPVLDIRDKAFDFPELNLKAIESGKTIKTVQLDMRYFLFSNLRIVFIKNNILRYEP